MTEDDKDRWRLIYHRLCFAYQKKRDVVEHDVYFDALRPLSVDAVAAGCLELERVPVATGRSFFPRSPDIFERATAYEAKIIEREIVEYRQLSASPDQIARDMSTLRAAHAKAIEELKAKGLDGAALVLEAITPRHPSESDTICFECSDSGRVTRTGRRVACSCAGLNPKVRQRFIRDLGRQSTTRELLDGDRGGDGFARLVTDGESG